MNNYQLELKEEKDALDAKAEKLETFLESVRGLQANERERRLMERQLTVMKEYSKILRDRIITSRGLELD